MITVTRPIPEQMTEEPAISSTDVAAERNAGCRQTKEMTTMSSTSSSNTAVPAILTGQALRSLRDAGYSLAAAVGEVIDNALEADANEVAVVLDDEQDSRGRTHVRRIAVADDGTGMNKGPQGEDVLQHYLQLGYSSRYMSTTTIGKYGVGAKLAAFNFAERVDVWSCSDPKEGWRHVAFDLTEAEEQEKSGGVIEIAPPDREPIPDELADLVHEGTGTLVLWSKIDRLEAGKFAEDANQLRVELEKELSRMFREFVHGGIILRVNENPLLPHDPLFLMDNSWADQQLREHLHKSAKADGDPSRKVADHFDAEVIADEQVKAAGAKARVRVTLYPKEVTRKRQSGGDSLAKRLRVPDNEGAISFMRLNREINYTNVPRIFPRGVQEADRFIGIEVQFTPEFDESFGVRHVKRGVEPHGALRDAIRKVLARYLPVARKRLEERWGAVAKKEQEHAGEHAAITGAVSEINQVLPKSRADEPVSEEEHVRALGELAEDVGKTSEQEKQEYIARVRDLPFVIESVNYPGQTFIDVQHLSGQVIIRLNTRHRFYRELWEPIREIAELDPGAVSGEQAVRTARRTLEALSLLVVAYGKAESMDENPQEKYMELRNYWGMFLDTLMGKIKDVV
jgi:hypothetical protein